MDLFSSPTLRKCKLVYYKRGNAQKAEEENALAARSQSGCTSSVVRRLLFYVIDYKNRCRALMQFQF
jgi:hypothetical protein